MIKSKIRTGDEVIVLSGNYKGSKGIVSKVFPKKNKAIIKGINIIKKHIKSTVGNPKGGIIEKEASLYISNIACLDPKNGKPTRIGFQILNGEKIRISKKSGEVLRNIVKNKNIE